MTIEELVEAYKKAEGAIEEMEAQKQVVRDAILDELRKKKITGYKTENGYYVNKVITTRFTDVPMSVCRELGAIKTVEKQDTTKLKKLIEKGAKIKGAKTTAYLRIKEI